MPIPIPTPPHPTKSSLLNLLPQHILKRNGISRELGDALAQLLDGHLVLVEVEAVEGLIVEVVALGDVERLGVFGVEFLGHFVRRGVEVFEEVGLMRRNLFSLGSWCKGVRRYRVGQGVYA